MYRLEWGLLEETVIFCDSSEHTKHEYLTSSHRSGDVVQDLAGQEERHHHWPSDQEVEPAADIPVTDLGWIVLNVLSLPGADHVGAGATLSPS